jgi:hypothetical protein
MTETRPPDRRRALVCLPTYDEKDNVVPITEAILAATPDVDVLIIDDNSPDGTGRLADAVAAREPRVRVLHRKGKEGLGKAYLAGFDWALREGYELILEMDADFSHDPKYLPAMLEAARSADVVLGSRNIPGGGTVNWGVGRKIISRGGSLYARTILGLPRPHRGVQVLPPEGPRVHRPPHGGVLRLRLPDRAHLPGRPAGLPGGGDPHRLRGPAGRAVQDVQADRSGSAPKSVVHSTLRFSLTEARPPTTDAPRGPDP